VPAWFIIIVVVIFAIIDTIRSKRAKYMLPYELMDQHASELLEKNSKMYESSIEFYKEVIKGYDGQLEILQGSITSLLNSSIEMLKFEEYLVQKIINNDFNETEIKELIKTHQSLKEQLSALSK
jgi:prefoldin subunit 5